MSLSIGSDVLLEPIAILISDVPLTTCCIAPFPHPQAASFYGLSYIRLPIHESKNSTDIEFRFKTHQLTAFLFLAVGTSDYCFLYLENGQLAARINVGFGETYLASDNLNLNDLRWHHVKVKQIKHKLVMKIDDKYTFEHKISGNSFEMNIQHGVFLGGQDHFKSLYLGNINYLRGCIDQVFWNGKDILLESHKHGIWHDVTAEVCDSEFSANANTTISFVESNSFVLTDGIMSYGSNNTHIEFDMKSLSDNALLMFNPSDNPNKRQYFAVELINKMVKVSINDGFIETAVQSTEQLDSVVWHHVSISVDSSRIVLSIDGKIGQVPVKKARTTKPQYSNQLFIGGVSTSKQSLALNYKLQSVLVEQNVSLKGCVRNIQINSNSVGILNMIATKQIQTGKCKWNSVCSDATKAPCVDGSRCVQQQINRVKCVCAHDNCVNALFKHKSITAYSENLINCNSNLQTLDVPEGSSAILNTKIFKQILQQKKGDKAKLKFSIAKLPQFGRLENVSSKDIPNVGQWIDFGEIDGERLRYTHNSLTHWNDSIVLQVFDKGGLHSSCDPQQYTIPIRIRSSNDAPIKQKNIVKFKMMNNSRKVISSSMLKTKAKDGKNKKKTEERMYKVMKVTGSSYFARLAESNVTVKEFTEEELKDQSIVFVHVGDRNSSNHKVEATLLASVKDSDKSDHELKLEIEPYELDVHEQNNTGLMMAHYTFSLITASNLSYTSDSPQEQSQAIKYEVLSGPRFGVIQKLRSVSSHWINVTNFTQRHVDRGKVRYLHQQQKPETDRIQLQVSFNKQVIDTIWFNMKFVENIEIVELGNNHYNLSENDKEVIITNHELSYQTEPIRTMAEEIVLTLLSVPLSGSIYLIQPNGLQTKLKIGSSFTQKNVDDNQLLYVRNSSGFIEGSTKSQIDFFEFEVALLGQNATRNACFNINIQQVTDQYILINNEINVFEGGKSLIGEESLYFLTGTESNTDNQIVFNVTKHPKHGAIKVLSAVSQDVIASSPSQIDQALIKKQRIIYEHDDSENDFDYFEFIVINQTKHIVSSGKFVITVKMINDNPPVRLINKTLEVVRHGQRNVLKSDVRYTDHDINTPQSAIVYSKVSVPNGSFYLINNTYVDHFSQEDINKGLVVFKHNGADEAKITFIMTDGKYLVPDIWLVKASNAFIEVTVNTGIIAKYGENNLITSQNLTIKSNMANLAEISIKIVTEPMYGQILVNDKPANQFTLQELENDMVEYESTIFEDETPQSKRDLFEFRILNNYGIPHQTYEFVIRIFPQSYFCLNLTNNKNLTTFEGEKTVIGNETLLVEHSELKPEEIIYEVTQKPLNGIIHNLRIKSLEPVYKFSQSDVNDGYVVYQSYETNPASNVDVSDNTNWDKFTFNVGNQVAKLTNMDCHIQLIPKWITISTNNLTVTEGKSAILGNDSVHVSHPYYSKLIDEFIVVEEPKYGIVSLIAQNNVKVSAKSFTLEQLSQNLICYEHDSSEVDRDWFTIVARSNSLDKESLPATIHITIISVNDEWPQIVNNSEVEVWTNDSVLITNGHLASVDDDSSSDEILYVITLLTNGYLIDIDSNMTIDKFTQRDIDSEKVYFVHVGTENGSFRFQVSDGRNNGISGMFTVKVKARKVKIEVNQKLFVDPGMQQSITKQHLLVTSNDDSENREFTYRVIKAPTYGRIILETFKNGNDKLKSFTQKQIDENLVLYEQNVPITSPIVIDRVIFDVESPNLVTLKSVYFVIEIAVKSLRSILPSDTKELVRINPLIVEEGKFKELTSNEIDFKNLKSQIRPEDKIFLKISTSPINGVILKNGLSVQKNEMIPLNAFTNQSFVYKHDDSNTFNDSVDINVYLVNKFTISVINFTMPIEIVPVNDEFPMVINRKPLLEATSGTKTLITKQTFNVRDNDGLESRIVYQVRYDNESSDGYFIVDPNDKAVQEFTQSNINQERVFYVSGGKRSQHTIWFRVKDDPLIECNPNDEVELPFEQLIKSVSNSHCSQYYPLQITVSQLSLELVNHTTIQLIQGTFQVSITKANLETRSKKSHPSKIFYKITRGPFHGYISVNGQIERDRFTQQQIDDNLVHYRQQNLSTKDYFLVDVFLNDHQQNEKSIYNINVQIGIKPLVRAIRPFLIAHPESQALLSYEYLDASELALKSNFNPRFRILQELRYGTFRMLRFGDTGKADDVIYEFTHENIIHNQVVYVANANNDLDGYNEILIEIVHYELSSRNVQNANGVFVVNIVKNSTETGSELIKHSSYDVGIMLSNETIIILFTSCIFLILLVAFIAILKFCSRKTSNESFNKNDSVKTLPRNNLDNSSREYSNNSSLKQTDCSIRSSSSSPFDNNNLINVDVPSISPSMIKKFERTNLNRNKQELADYSGQLFMRCDNVNDKLHDISPLPPPSLFFINENLSSPEEKPFWNKRMLSNTTNSKKMPDYSYRSPFEVTDERNIKGTKRSSGDGTSNSESPRFCTKQRLNSMNELTEFEPYLTKNCIQDKDFCTLDSRKCKLKSTHTKFKNQYWI